jgi:hypothetical protein
MVGVEVVVVERPLLVLSVRSEEMGGATVVVVVE